VGTAGTDDSGQPQMMSMGSLDKSGDEPVTVTRKVGRRNSFVKPPAFRDYSLDNPTPVTHKTGESQVNDDREQKTLNDESVGSEDQPVAATKKVKKRRGPRHGSMMGVPPSMNTATGGGAAGVDRSAQLEPVDDDGRTSPMDISKESDDPPVAVTKKAGRRRGPRHGSMMGVPPVSNYTTGVGAGDANGSGQPHTLSMGATCESDDIPVAVTRKVQATPMDISEDSIPVTRRVGDSAVNMPTVADNTSDMETEPLPVTRKVRRGSFVMAPAASVAPKDDSEEPTMDVMVRNVTKYGSIVRGPVPISASDINTFGTGQESAHVKKMSAPLKGQLHHKSNGPPSLSRDKVDDSVAEKDLQDSTGEGIPMVTSPDKNIISFEAEKTGRNVNETKEKDFTATGDSLKSAWNASYVEGTKLGGTVEPTDKEGKVRVRKTRFFDETISAASAADLTSVGSREKAIQRPLVMPKQFNAKAREAIFAVSDDTDYEKVIVPKSDKVKKLVYNAIKPNILFKACSSEELTDLVDVFEEEHVRAGKIVIKAGDAGDQFYVIERGTLDVYVEDRHVRAMYSGMSFGEIALLYGCPRSATLRARHDCKLWKIDRRAFRGITGKFKQGRMVTKAEFLKKVKIGNKVFGVVLTNSEINAMASATQTQTYQKGDVIVKQGDNGDVFYMIEDGTVEVFIDARGDTPVVTLEKGQFFGEKALLSDDVRSATCIASSTVKCLTLIREDFNLLLGNLQDLLDGHYSHRDSVATRGSVGPSDHISIEYEIQFELKDLEIDRILGVGAFGQVSLVKWRNPDSVDPKEEKEFFALKRMSKAELTKLGLTQRVEHEKRILSELNHPFINRFYSSIEDEENLYFVLEPLLGGELCIMLQNQERFSEEWSRFYAGSVLYAFCHIHSKKIAYRDLKPENLVMDSEGYIKVVDMGLAKKILGGSKTWTFCGTPDYLAPEIILNEGHDWSVDYWALGIFLFEMVEGMAPFYAENPMDVYQNIIDCKYSIPEHFSFSLRDLVRRLLNPSQTKRLGRTMGGGGAVMQHKWFSSLDWDALIDKTLEAPYIPRVELSDDIAVDDEASVNSNLSEITSELHEGDKIKPIPESEPDSKPKTSAFSNRMTYSLGQGNRHRQKLMEMMEVTRRESEIEDSKQQQMSSEQPEEPRQGRHPRPGSQSMKVGPGVTRQSSVPKSCLMKSMQLVPSNQLQGLGKKSAAVAVDVDAFLKIQLLNLGLHAKAESPEQANMAFHQFALLSARPDMPLDEQWRYYEEIVGDNGTRNLDPFKINRIDVMDQFSTIARGDNDITPEALSAFCFDDGIKARLFPRTAIEGAHRLGWVGEQSDVYRSHVFTDVTGALRHGIAITVWEEVDVHDSTLAECLFIMREQRRAATMISRCYRIYRQRVAEILLKNKELNKEDDTGLRRFGLNKVNSFFYRSKQVTKEDKTEKEKTTTYEKLYSKLKATHRATQDEQFYVGWGNGNGAEQQDTMTARRSAPLPSEEKKSVEELASEAYRAMVASDKRGDICVIEKCYVFIGTRPKEHSALFCALQQMVDWEREVRSTNTIKTLLLNERCFNIY